MNNDKLVSWTCNKTAHISRERKERQMCDLYCAMGQYIAAAAVYTFCLVNKLWLKRRITIANITRFDTITKV